MKKRMKSAAVCTAIMIGGMAALSGCGKSKTEPVDQMEHISVPEDEADMEESDLSLTSEIEAIEIPEHVEQTLTITATGDCTLGKTQDHSYEGSFYAYYDSYGADYFFEDVRDVFASDDMTIVNLECVLSTATERVEKTFNLKGEPEYVGIMTGSSVEACSLGNNHTYDYGEAGFQETKQVLDEAGITYAFLDQEGMYTTADGIKVGIVSASLLNQSSDRTDKLKSQIADLRNEGADVVIACCHWGVEREYYPTEYQRSTAHDLIDAGADLIIGNHPHVLQGVEIYEGKVICYSLGNFCFGGNKNPSDKNTMMFQQTFTIVDGKVQTGDIDARIIPCRLSSVNGYNDYQPTVAEGETKQKIIDLVNEYSSSYSELSFSPEGTLLLP